MPDLTPLPDLHLRTFERRDFPCILQAIDTPEALMQWAGPLFTFPLDEAQLECYRLSAQQPTAARRVYTACLAGGEPVGHIELNEIDGHSARLCVHRQRQHFGRCTRRLQPQGSAEQARLRLLDRR